jgi:sigma-E factor negative regulatory protein RseA
MSQWSDSGSSAREQLSALVDGEAEASEVQRACALWRDDASLRTTWHSYQLIGDVLRSDQLASAASKDAAFLTGLRVKLAHEPVVLAPEPAQASAPRSKVWRSSAAVAAGFVAVIGVVSVMQFPGGSSTDGGLTAGGGVLVAPASLQTVSAGESGSNAGEPPSVVLNGRLIRDARLDQYLAVHKKFGGSSAPGVPSGFLRNAAADGTGR